MLYTHSFICHGRYTTVEIYFNYISVFLRRIFGRKRDEVTGELRKLYNEERNDLYSTPTIVYVMKLRRMRWAGHVSWAGEWRGTYRVLVGKETTAEIQAEMGG
jgi:hypothetical protein